MPKICILAPRTGHYPMSGESAAHYRQLLGSDLVFRPWNSPGDLDKFALIMPLLAWGYHLNATHWFVLLESWNALPFVNSIATLRWNSDKSYLLDLERAGVRIVATRISENLQNEDLAVARDDFSSAELIIKPPISGGADATHRLAPDDEVPDGVLGRTMLIQPLVQSVADEGEYSLFYFDGVFSHAIVKRPAAGDFRVQEQFGGQEFAVDAPQTALNLAKAALAVCPEPPLYARVDVVRGAEDGFQLMELELIEPALFLEHAPDLGQMFADAVAKRLSRS